MSFESLVTDNKFTNHLGDVYLLKDEVKKLVYPRVDMSVFDNRVNEFTTDIGGNDMIKIDNVKEIIKNGTTKRCKELQHNVRDVTKDSLINVMNDNKKRVGAHQLCDKIIPYIQVWDDIWMSGNDVLDALGYTDRESLEILSNEYKCFYRDIHTERCRITKQHLSLMGGSTPPSTTSVVDINATPLPNISTKPPPFITPKTWGGFAPKYRVIYINRAGVIELIDKSGKSNAREIKKNMKLVYAKLSLNHKADVSKDILESSLTPQLEISSSSLYREHVVSQLNDKSNLRGRSTTSKQVKTTSQSQPVHSTSNYNTRRCRSAAVKTNKELISLTDSRACVPNTTLTKCVYILDPCREMDDGTKLYKYGMSDDITSRFNSHQNTYDNMKVLLAIESSDPAAVEKFFEKQLDLRKLLTYVSIDGVSKNEFFKLSKEISLDDVKQLMKDSVDIIGGIDVRNHEYRMLCKELEIEREHTKQKEIDAATSLSLKEKDIILKDKEIELAKIHSMR